MHRRAGLRLDLLDSFDTKERMLRCNGTISVLHRSAFTLTQWLIALIHVTPIERCH